MYCWLFPDRAVGKRTGVLAEEPQERRDPGRIGFPFPLFSALRKFFFRNRKIKFSGIQIDLDPVAILDQCQRTDGRGFRGKITDRKTARTAREPPVRDDRHIMGKSASLQFLLEDVCSRSERSFRAEVAQNCDIAFFDLSSG